MGFVIGCSFTFEEALVVDGIELRHVKSGTNVAMFQTSGQTEPAGPFSGPLVVSMRPLKSRDAIHAVQITACQSLSVFRISTVLIMVIPFQCW